MENRSEAIFLLRRNTAHFPQSTLMLTWSVINSVIVCVEGVILLLDWCKWASVICGDYSRYITNHALMPQWGDKADIQVCRKSPPSVTVTAVRSRGQGCHDCTQAPRYTEMCRWAPQLHPPAGAPGMRGRGCRGVLESWLLFHRLRINSTELDS